MTRHQSALLRGAEPCCGQRCQKQPSTNTASRRLGNTTSARRRNPGTGARLSRYRKPRRWSSRLSATSGAVSRVSCLRKRCRTSSFSGAGRSFPGPGPAATALSSVVTFHALTALVLSPGVAGQPRTTTGGSPGTVVAIVRNPRTTYRTLPSCALTPALAGRGYTGLTPGSVADATGNSAAHPRRPSTALLCCRRWCAAT